MVLALAPGATLGWAGQNADICNSSYKFSLNEVDMEYTGVVRHTYI